MTIRDLLKRTPFRLAVTFSLFFITTVLVLFVVIYIGASARLVSDIRGRVQATQNSLALLDTEMTFDNLIKVVQGEAESVRDPDFIIELVDNPREIEAHDAEKKRAKATTAKKKASKKAKTEAKGDDEVAEPSASE